jgi:hypothetical protein
MGSAVEPPVSPQHELRIRVVGTAPIAKVELVRRGQGPVSVFDGDGRREWSGSVSVPILEGVDYLYARVLQEDGGAAWSSPFFAVQAEASRGSP